MLVWHLSAECAGQEEEYWCTGEEESGLNLNRKKTETPEKKKTRVDLLYADEAQADKQLRPDVQVLIGSVRMKHDSMYMFCDSALIFEKINSVEAFGNVRMEQGDTLFIYGDYLYYDGMSQLACCVRMYV